MINIHAPTEDMDIDEKSEFYERLKELLVGLPGREIRIILGDCNAKVGQEQGY